MLRMLLEEDMAEAIAEGFEWQKCALKIGVRYEYCPPAMDPLSPVCQDCVTRAAKRREAFDG